MNIRFRHLIGADDGHQHKYHIYTYFLELNNILQPNLVIGHHKARTQQQAHLEAESQAMKWFAGKLANAVEK